MARVVIPDLPHHVTQPGSRRARHPPRQCKGRNLYGVPDIPASSTVKFAYAGWLLLAEFKVDPVSGQDKLWRSYTWGQDVSGGAGPNGSAAAGIGGLVAVTHYDNDGNITAKYWPIYDGNGNVTSLVKDAAGYPVAASFEYGPFGQPTAADGLDFDSITDLCPFLFSTKYYDKEVGLYYFGKRYQDPATGSFPNGDPLAESGGLNLYGFCQNDPVNNLDPLGEQLGPTTRPAATSPLEKAEGYDWLRRLARDLATPSAKDFRRGTEAPSKMSLLAMATEYLQLHHKSSPDREDIARANTLKHEITDATIRIDIHLIYANAQGSKAINKEGKTAWIERIRDNVEDHLVRLGVRPRVTLDPIKAVAKDGDKDVDMITLQPQHLGGVPEERAVKIAKEACTPNKLTLADKAILIVNDNKAGELAAGHAKTDWGGGIVDFSKGGARDLPEMAYLIIHEYLHVDLDKNHGDRKLDQGLFVAGDRPANWISETMAKLLTDRKWRPDQSVIGEKQ